MGPGGEGRGSAWPTALSLAYAALTPVVLVYALMGVLAADRAGAAGNPAWVRVFLGAISPLGWAVFAALVVIGLACLREAWLEMPRTVTTRALLGVVALAAVVLAGLRAPAPIRQVAAMAVWMVPALLAYLAGVRRAARGLRDEPTGWDETI